MNELPATDPGAAADAFLASLSLGGGAAPSLPPPIGGVAPPPLDISDPRVNEQLSSDRPSVIYREGDDYTYFEAMPLELRVRLQDQLVSLGLSDGVIRGELDNATIGGMAKLMALANRSGTTWRATLNRLVKLNDDGLLNTGSSAKVNPYLPPDYASLAQRVKATFRDALDRDPTQAEMQLTVNELFGDFREQYDAEQATGAGREVSVSQVDPIARFQEAFEARYKPEVEQIELEQDVQTTARDAQSQADSIASIAGI